MKRKPRAEREPQIRGSRADMNWWPKVSAFFLYGFLVKRRQAFGLRK